MEIAMNIRQFDKEYPIYIGVSKKEFEEIKRRNKLYADLFEFTDSMDKAEKNAIYSAEVHGEEKGFVIKFNTAKLLEEEFSNNFTIYKFISGIVKSMSLNRDKIIIKDVFKYVLGYYEIGHQCEHHNEYF